MLDWRHVAAQLHGAVQNSGVVGNQFLAIGMNNSAGGLAARLFTLVPKRFSSPGLVAVARRVHTCRRRFSCLIFRPNVLPGQPLR